MIEAILRKNKAIGREQAMTINELCIAARTTPREITKAIEEERKSGVLICSKMEGKGGYFMPANDVEVREQYESLQRRIKAQAITIRAFRRYMEERA